MSDGLTGVSPSEARKSISDGAVTIGERVVSQAAQFVIFILAARFLGPAEFGVFALVSACAILTLRASEVGWAEYIMNWSGSSDVPRQVLMISVACGALFFGVGLLGAQIVQVFGVGPEIITLIQVFSIWVWIATISSAQKGMMIWMKRLKAAATCEIIGEAVGLAVAVSALLMDQGFLALAYGRVAYQCVHLVASFYVTRLLPQPGMQLAVFKDLLRFSMQFFTSRMLIHTRLYVATFIIGGYLGPTAVGYYRAADRLVSAVSELIFVPARLLAWTNFKSARDAGDAETANDRINAALRLWMKGILMFGIPIFLWVIVCSDALIEGLLTSTWLPAAPLVALLAIGRLLLLFGPATEPIMSVSGQVSRLPLFTAVMFLVSVGATLLAAQFGVYAVAFAQIAVGLFGFVATLWLYSKYAQIDLGGVWKTLRPSLLPLAVGALALVGSAYLLSFLTIYVLVQALLSALGALMAYLAALYVFDRQTIDLLLSLRRGASGSAVGGTPHE
ncbi:MAG: oligosaccharide flippase family protein [Rhodobacteraceae bacterium]|nr:oligosaccharide flippase family protein [Paracoccaceae bacterium]